MRKYPDSHWEALGQWIHDARLQGGHTDMKQWALLVGRSTRQLQGLERGESVGPKTIEAVAHALGVAPWHLFGRLADPALTVGDLDSRQVASLRADYEREVREPALTTGRARDMSYEDLWAEWAQLWAKSFTIEAEYARRRGLSEPADARSELWSAMVSAMEDGPRWRPPWSSDDDMHVVTQDGEGGEDVLLDEPAPSRPSPHGAQDQSSR